MAALIQAAGSADTTLSLDNTANFPVDGGTVLIGSEVISFTTATDRQLIGCTRAQQGTSAASHAAGVSVTLLESFPFAQVMGLSSQPLSVSMAMNVLSLTNPTAVFTRAQIEANTVISVTLSSGSAQSYTLPLLQASTARLLIISLATGASTTLTVNTVGITAGTAQMFMWNGSAWYSVA